jgi:hypothetical protein
MLDVLNTQPMNKRSLAEKNYLVIISFRDGEEPDIFSLASIEGRLCDALSFTTINGSAGPPQHQQPAPARCDLQDPPDALHDPRAVPRLPGACRDMRQIEDDYSRQKDNHMPRKED